MIKTKMKKFTKNKRHKDKFENEARLQTWAY